MPGVMPSATDGWGRSFCAFFSHHVLFFCLGCWFLKQRGLTSPSGFLLGLCSTSVRFLRPCPPSLHSIISFVFGAPVVYHSHTPGGWGCTCPPSHQIRGSSMCRLAPSLSFGDGQRLDGGFRLGGPAWCPGHAWCRASECQGSCGHRALAFSIGLHLRGQSHRNIA